MPIADITTDLFWDAFASAEFADTIAVDPSDVATIRFLHSLSTWPDPSPEFAVRLRSALPAAEMGRVWATTPEGEIALDTKPR